MKQKHATDQTSTTAAFVALSATSRARGNSLCKNTDNVGVIFLMTIDRSKTLTAINPFATIHEHSTIPSEQEILFTMHTIFRVVEIKPMAKNSHLWEVQLTITDDNDS
ncbi:unnamed protein product [Rotaria magnacalcarata]|uniref:Uncharacterized protein n=1 Tax=Rotaria magnacalcarata TaxID=392030 RepID=A0A819XWG5_9BILA|nr:unnamed protein product [Rotaria magnacalcarata]